MPRWGSPARIGRPEAVREPWMAHELEPPSWPASPAARSARSVAAASITATASSSRSMAGPSVGAHHGRRRAGIAHHPPGQLGAGGQRDRPPPQLAVQGAHEDVAHLVDGDAVPRLPPLGRRRMVPELLGQVVGVGRQPGVDPTDVGLGHGPGPVVEGAVVGPGHARPGRAGGRRRPRPPPPARPPRPTGPGPAAGPTPSATPGRRRPASPGPRRRRAGRRCGRARYPSGPG